MSRPHVLLLAGTAEARELAERLASLPLRLTVSLSGSTRCPAAYPGTVRQGGFGGMDGLAAWLTAEAVTAVIDATHPYATRITANAATAASIAKCPHLRLERSPWEARPGEAWNCVPDLETAIAALPSGARALLATGSGSIESLRARSDVQLFLRSIEPVSDLPEHVTPIVARPPFTEAQERELMIENGITHLITRNSGGSGRMRLAAAAGLGLPIVMINRPELPEGSECVHTVPEALAWLRRRLSLDTASGAAP